MQPIVTDRLILRELNYSDSQFIHELAADPRVIRFQGWGPNTFRDSLQFLAAALRDNRQVPRLRYDFLIETRHSGKAIGTCGVRLIRGAVLEADIGYNILPLYWHNGFGTEAARTLLDFVFHDLGVFRVTAACNPQNRASLRILEDLGMVPSPASTDRCLVYAKLNTQSQSASPAANS